MKSLREYLQDAQDKKMVIWHFNAASYEQVRAYYIAAEKLRTPIIIGLSEGERQYLDMKMVCDIARGAREKEIPLFVNADHTHSYEKIIEAVQAGCDEVLFDAGKEDIEINSARTKEVVAWVRAYNKSHHTDILVEGEIGYIGSGSVVRDHLPEGLSGLTDPYEAVRFVHETGVDLLAPAVGNIHGIIANQPALDIPRIMNIYKETNTPLVLHGGSGITHQDIQHALSEGICIIHIATELRVAWRRALEESLCRHKTSVAPYEILQDVVSLLSQQVLDIMYAYQKI